MGPERRTFVLRNMVIAVSSICFFMLHTALTFILEPEWLWTVFLIFAFGFIHQGLEYFLTIPSQRVDTGITSADMLLNSLLFPQAAFLTMGLADPVGLGRALLSTAGCIFVILLYRLVRRIVTLSLPKE